MPDFNVTRLDRLRYRPTKSAEEFLDGLRSTLIPSDKATVARLALGRSLAEASASQNLALPRNAEMGHAIEGTHLFGEDTDIWACLISVSATDAPLSGNDFRDLVEAHWHHGAMLLKRDYQDVGQSDVEFVLRLAGMVPTPRTAPVGEKADVTESTGPIKLHFGSESADFSTKEPMSFVLNGPGISPHLALLGKTRSGKTRTGLDIAKEIVGQADIPMLLVDPKGEFVKDGELLSKSEWNGGTLADFFAGIEPLDVPTNPLPLDFLWRPPGATSSQLAALAMGFRDSFEKCIRARGDVVLDTLRQAVLDLLEQKRNKIGLDNILDRFSELQELEGKGVGGIGAKLRELVSLNVVTATRSPADFFSRRWVLSLGGTTAEPRRLTIFLLLDALNTYLSSLPDSSVDESGNRSLRHLLVIDEAREILSYKHGALSSLIRKSASKGGVTMLLSQSPDDFEQEEDDFLEQMGTIGVFASASTRIRRLSAGFGKKMRVEDVSDRSLPKGVALVKFPGQAPRKIVAWK